MMPPVSIRQFTPADADTVIDLWRECGLTRPWNDPRSDIARKLASQPELFLVAESGGVVIGSVMAGYDGHRGWMYYLACSPDHRGRGIATKLVEEVEQRLEALGCPKSQLMVRADNAGAIGFYTALGYEVSEVAVLGRRLIKDSPTP